MDPKGSKCGPMSMTMSVLLSKSPIDWDERFSIEGPETRWKGEARGVEDQKRYRGNWSDSERDQASTLWDPKETRLVLGAGVYACTGASVPRCTTDYLRGFTLLLWCMEYLGTAELAVKGSR